MSAPSPYFDRRAVEGILAAVRSAAARLQRRITVMEVCGTHTHAVAAAGLRRLLPDSVRLVAGPGCPVCVTPVGYLDRAEAIAALPDTIVCTFGDLLRVPSSRGSLEQARAHGARITVTYSARDALDVARSNPGARVVFLAVGFETTAPTIAAAIAEAEAGGVANFQILPGNKVMPPPMRALMADPEVAVNGFLLPGHVSVITGAEAFRFVSDEFGLPAAVVGFAPTDVLRGVLELVGRILRGEPAVVNLYGRVVTPAGNTEAKRLLARFFGPSDEVWRGLGSIPASGLALRPEWAHRDASLLPVELPEPVEPAGCRCGEVLKGTVEPPDCPLFDAGCSPDTPVGACMVSSEGTCAAWYRHSRFDEGGTQ